jgi:hypothetical protein
MAEVEYNPAVKGFRGKIKELLFKRVWGKETVSASPDFSDRVLTEKQKAQNERVKAANRYGKALGPEDRAFYEARAKLENKPLYAVIVRDWFHRPCVEEIEVSSYSGQAGQTIRIRATDDTEVKTVEVGVRDKTGQLLESGQAKRIHADKTLWEYTTTADLESTEGLTLEVTASDRPGNRDQRSQALQSGA